MNVVMAASGTNPGSVILGLVLIAVAFVLYWVPLIVAARRKVPNVGSVAVVNLFLGWTIIGWIVALAMALRDPRPVP